MVIYAMAIYPIIGFMTELGYPRYPIFGVAPCPVTIFTFGLALWTDKKVPVIAAIIPLIWALMGVLAVAGLDIWADVGLILSGIVGFPPNSPAQLKDQRLRSVCIRNLRRGVRT